MKNNFNKIKLVVLLILVLVSSNSFSQSPSSPKEVIAVFPYQHVNKCVCNYNCSYCWKFSCESCKKGFNNYDLKCGNKNCFKYLKHVVPEVFEDANKHVYLIVDNFRITYNEASDMEHSLKDDEKLIFVKLLL